MTIESRLLPDPTQSLERAFAAAAGRMRGLGFVNAALHVQAVGFAPWDGHWLGVMVTPWSINLMLVPRDPSQWQPVNAGMKQRFSFPAGDFEFIDALDTVIGEYRMCSLFSPVMEFEDQATAEMVARVALKALRDARLDDAEAAPPGHASAPALAQASEQSARPMSKRDFLGGRFVRSSESDVPGR
jgi:[NiFe] hydrogenase assembly HybE family chaperone